MKKPNQFLGVHFKKCGSYGRLYLDRSQGSYIGRCPKCGTPVKVKIGPSGTKQRFFVAKCP